MDYRSILVSHWLDCQCEFMRLSSPSDFMIERVRYSVELLDDEEVLDLVGVG